MVMVVEIEVVILITSIILNQTHTNMQDKLKELKRK